MKKGDCEHDSFGDRRCQTRSKYKLILEGRLGDSGKGAARVRAAVLNREAGELDGVDLCWNRAERALRITREAATEEKPSVGEAGRPAPAPLRRPMLLSLSRCRHVGGEK